MFVDPSQIFACIRAPINCAWSRVKEAGKLDLSVFKEQRGTRDALEVVRSIGAIIQCGKCSTIRVAVNSFFWVHIEILVSRGRTFSLSLHFD
jgi:hypothetical protein